MKSCETVLYERVHKKNHAIFLLGYDKIAKPLIQYGANVNVVGQNGSTPLTLAAEKGRQTEIHSQNTW